MPWVPPDQTAGARPAVATSPVPKRSPRGEPGSARAPPIVAPLSPFVPVKEACVVGGFGRSKLYEVVGAGRVRAVKLGSKTLIDTASLLTFLESLPAAQIRPAKPKRTARAEGKADAALNLPDAILDGRIGVSQARGIASSREAPPGESTTQVGANPTNRGGRRA
jgi:excisionase family DNA binding protein